MDLTSSTEVKVKSTLLNSVSNLNLQNQSTRWFSCWAVITILHHQTFQLTHSSFISDLKVTKALNMPTSFCQLLTTWKDQEPMLTPKEESKWVMRSWFPQVKPKSNGKSSELYQNNAAFPCLTTVWNNLELVFMKSHHIFWNTTTLKTAFMARFQTNNTK